MFALRAPWSFDAGNTGIGGPTGLVVKPFHNVPDLESPIAGTYKTSFTKEELAASPLLYDTGELNNENWGDLTITLDNEALVRGRQLEAVDHLVALVEPEVAFGRPKLDRLGRLVLDPIDDLTGCRVDPQEP